MTNIRYVLCDVEGTTTDIQFVHKKLFPYATEHIESFYEQNPDTLQKSAWVYGIDPTEVMQHVQELISQDVKDAELKRIQGLIWKTGYMSGTLQGHVYKDVLPAFQRWKEKGLGLGIYSSGSIQAQKLIYGYSVAGDLTIYIDNHFDLGIGYKYEAQSYRKIVNFLQLPAQSILFLSDIEKELDCAREVGMQTIRLFRDELEETSHPFKDNFDGILT